MVSKIRQPRLSTLRKAKRKRDSIHAHVGERGNRKSQSDLVFRLNNILAFAKGSLINIVAAIYETLQAAPSSGRAQLLQIAAERFLIEDSTGKRAVKNTISESEAEELANRFGKTVDAMLAALVKENLPQNVFYERLLTTIDNPFFESKKGRIFALYSILIDKRLPYFQIPVGLKMSNEEFRQRLRSVQDARARLTFVLFRDFQQRTEEADIILQLLDQTDRVNRVVLLAYIFHVLRHEKNAVSEQTTLLEK